MGLSLTRDVFRQPHLRGPSADRRETLPHDRNLGGMADQGPTTWGSSPKNIGGQKHAKFRSMFSNVRL